ncbi:MAG: hypothetical protein QGG14_04980, partial [Planctomycetota bacterium]|nr:hypothetical protein [Planctomycetota bacterium]
MSETSARRLEVDPPIAGVKHRRGLVLLVDTDLEHFVDQVERARQLPFLRDDLEDLGHAPVIAVALHDECVPLLSDALALGLIAEVAVDLLEAFIAIVEPREMLVAIEHA